MLAFGQTAGGARGREIDDLVKSGIGDSVPDPRSPAFAAHDAGPLQDRQVVGNVGLFGPHVRAYLAHAARSAAQLFQDLKPYGVSQDAEGFRLGPQTRFLHN